MRSMGTGDYICVTLRGGAPWGFALRVGEGDTYRPFLVSQVKPVRLILVQVLLKAIGCEFETKSMIFVFRNLEVGFL